MKKILFAVIGIVCLMTSCSKDDFTENQINPNSGKEVNFGMTIDAGTRTLYGPESTDGTKNPIYWVHGDNITIYGVDCAVGRNQADYAVSTEGVDAEGKTVINTTQNYATNLNKTGDYGVQWGDKTSSDFFAVYPKVEAGAFKNNGDGSVTVRTKVNKTQNVRFEYNEAKNTWVGTHYSGTLAEGNSMTDAVMYAITPNAQSTASQVDLRFTPYSTVLRFTFEGFSVAKAAGSNEIDYTSEISINRIVLSAPNKYISGEFDLTLDNEKEVSSDISDTSKASGEIIILPNHLPIKSKQKLQFDIFTIPQEGAVMPGTKDVWAVTFETNKGNIVYNLQPLKNGEPTDAPLQIAQIHKINIPERHIVTDFEIPAETWMRYIPRNVYLSELSVPGTWYSLNGTYQTHTSLTDQFNAGIRAFNIDTRIIRNTGSGWGSYSSYNKTDGANLVVADSETADDVVIGWRISNIGTTVETAITNIISLAKTKPSEIVYIVLTIADKPKTESGSVFGSVDPAIILEQLQKVLDKDNIKDALYTDIDSNTTVGDILTSGKNIVLKINHNLDDFYSNDLTSGFLSSGIMGSFASMAAKTEYNTSSDNITDINGMHGTNDYKAYFGVMNSAPIYNGTEKTDLTYYYHQAQYTTSSDDKTATPASGDPTLGNRMRAIDDIIEKADSIYKASAHNAIFQIGIGGSIDGSKPSGVSNVLNPYLLEKINNKIKNEPSPVGIVLMNHATTTKTENGVTTIIGNDLTNAIIEMNTKFKLNRDENKVAWPDGNPFENIGGDDNTGGGTTDPDQPEV